jgi:hypothetical protein
MGAELVEPAAAWVTAWPSWLACALLLAGLWMVRRALRPPRAWLTPSLAFVLLALLVRFLWMPVTQAHHFDGHEADYVEFFAGIRDPHRGGTVLYPAMQWLYWLLGKALHGSGWLLVISGLASLLSIGAAAGMAGTLFGRRAAIWTALLLSLYGNHAFWSSSAYNIMIPLALSTVSLWALLLAGRGGGLGATLVAAAAGVLAVATRLESGAMAVPALLILLRWPPRPLRHHLPVLLGALALGAAAVVPLVYPGGMPGSGEHSFMWPINLGLLDYLAPWGGAWLLPLVVMAWLPAPGLDNRLREGHLDRWAVVVLLTWALAVWGAMSSFDDFGYRHALPVGVALAMLCGGVLGALRRWPALAIGGSLALLQVLETQRIASLYYGSEERFALEIPATLPRLHVAQRPPCSLISEEPRVVGERQHSHFNLLDPVEAERLRAEGDGCLQWCPDLQDWRWSSRGVRDRALRLLHLYPAQPLAVLEHPDSGYACLLLELGERRPPTQAWFAPVAW